MMPKLTTWIPHEPTPKQAAFLLLPHREALYGGAARGGKSDALLMFALQYMDVPGHAAILFRRTFADLAQPGALIPRSHEWLGESEARWNEQTKTWTFPSGATLSFGYMDSPNDHYRYQGTQFQSIGFDELTQFREPQYRYLFSRLTRLAGSRLPLRVRSTSNPGGSGHDWVARRFGLGSYAEPEGGAVRPFIPARVADNPHVDVDEYVRSLSELDTLTRRQLLDGDWSARAEGSMFRREWFRFEEHSRTECRWVRRWDLAGSDVKSGTDPDYTAGALVGLHNGVWYIADMQHFRKTPGGVESHIRSVAIADGFDVPIRMEQEPGSSGKTVIDHYARNVLAGFDFRGVPSTGDKVTRARPFAGAAEAGNVVLVTGRSSAWIGPFLDELEAFPNGAHDDQIDAVSGATRDLVTQRQVQWF